ncbi:MAG: type IV pilus twitching motility protein PilT [Vulcanimicrobiota bacterium]
MQKIIQYLKEVVERGGSDLHISPDSPPMMRMNGELVHLVRNILTREETSILLKDMLDEEQLRILDESKSLDIAYEIPHAGYIQRFRCNLFYQKRGLDGVFRVIPREIPTLKDLNLPTSLEGLINFDHGLIIITGPTGSGKSTTISALIDLTNEVQYKHIITIEDPIEFVHPNKLSILHQRQVRLHTNNFYEALKTSLRQDPDIIMVGELRNQETVELALTAASTGQLVYTTMHTPTTSKAIERLVEFFPSQRQNSVRVVLAEFIRAIISQQLVPRLDGWGRIPAVEILINCPPIANMIREFKPHQILSIIQTSKNVGMVSMDDYLVKLFEDGVLSAETVYEYSIDHNRIKQKMGGS